MMSMGALSQPSRSTENVAGDPCLLSNNKMPQCTVMCVHHAHIGGFQRIVTVLWCKNLINHSLSLFIVNNNFHKEEERGGCVSLRIDLKPWNFWNKKGNKSLVIGGGCQIDVHWDLRSAKFSASPEPCADYYVCLVSDQEVVLMLGDYRKKAYKKTKARPALIDAFLVYKKENAYAKKSFSTKAVFDKKKKEHEIIVESSTMSSKDPEMWISIDGIVVIQIRNLQWKFRGNQTVMVNKQPVQVFWDVHDWLFNAPGGANQGLFIFKPGAPDQSPFDRGDDNECSSCGYSHGSSSGTVTHSDASDQECPEYYSPHRTKRGAAALPDFCFFLYAWKIE